MTGLGSSFPLLQELSDDLSGRDVVWRRGEMDGDPETRGGSNAIEILVRPADTRRLIESLNRLGFKEARPLASRRRARLVDYCGYDGQADRIVRVRACFRAESRDDATKDGRPRAGESTHRGPVTLVSGGALIAVVGADGAGKTTAVDALERWLHPQFRVVRIHMGKPPWSWATYAIKGLLKAVSVLEKLRPRRSPPGAVAPGNALGVRYLLWQATTARDRYRAYRRARRLAARGALVLCDRFPLPELRSMDGRRGGPLPTASRSWTGGLLANRLEHYYTSIGRPDLLVVLSIRPDLARGRSGDDPEDRVRQRALEVLSIDWSAVDARVLDAERNVSEVHQELKSWVWSRL